MKRFPFNLKITFNIMTLLMVAGNVCAQNVASPKADDPTPLEYRRVFVPEGHPDLWPMQNERYIPVPQSEFQKLLDDANRSSDETPFSSSEAEVRSADYDVTLQAEPGKKLEGNTLDYFLSGHASLQVVTDTKENSEASFLTLGPASMNLKDFAWTAEKQPIQTGTDAQGRLIAKIDRSGTLQFDLLAKNISTKPDELCFELSLPRSTRSAVTLTLDPSWTVSVTSGLLLGREALKPPVKDEDKSTTPKTPATDANQAKKEKPVAKKEVPQNPSKTRWTIAPTLEGQLHFLLIKEKDPSALPEIPDVCESLVYEFSPRGLEFRSVLRLAANGAMLPEHLRLGLEKPLTLFSARLGSEPVKWSLESEEAGRSIISLELPKSRPQKATLRLHAACPIIENDTWQLPRIIPEGVFWRSGNITLLATSPLSIGKLTPIGAVRTKTSELPSHKGRSVEMTSFRPDATATISLGWEKHLPTLNSGTLAELSGVGTTVTQTLLFTASQEDRFELSATVMPDWVIDSVESTPGSIIADWRLESSEDGKKDKLTIRLASALSKRHGTLRLQISARHLQSPLGKKLSMKDLTPVVFDDVHCDECLTAITTVDPYIVTYRNEEFVDNVPADELHVGKDALFSEIPKGRIFLDNDRSARLEIILEEQKPVYAATVETIVTISEKNLSKDTVFDACPKRRISIVCSSIFLVKQI